MYRLFAGIALPDALSARIALLQGGIAGARWVPPENYHVTLAFIGDTDEETAERADEALSTLRAESFSMALQGAGSFAQGEHPQVLWLGVAENEKLMRLQEKLCRALEQARVPFEKRKYTPHMTLARLKNPDALKLAEFIGAHMNYRSEVFEVGEIALYQSHQTKGGSVYEVLETYPLL
jgi:2'-5' RNA ligase